MEDIISESLWESARRIFDEPGSKNFLLCVPGLIFLKFVSNAYKKLLSELRIEYRYNMEIKARPGVPIIPLKAQWDYIHICAYFVDIRSHLDDAMIAIEHMNPSFKNILPKDYSSGNINKSAISQLIKELGGMPDNFLKTEANLKYAYENIVRKSLLLDPPTSLRGAVTSPRNVLKLMVSMIGPFRRKIFDPCCGFGSLLVEVTRYLKRNRISLEGIKFYGNENRPPLFQLCLMHLALYEICIDNMSCHITEKHKGLKADFLLCDPPFDSSGLTWIKYAEEHLSRRGYAALLISKGPVFLRIGSEPQVNKKLIETNRVDCIVTLPGHFFPMAEIQPYILILAMDRKAGNGRYRYRKNEILFIDAAALASDKNLKNKDITELDIYKIASVYSKWRRIPGKKMKMKEYCKVLRINR